MKIKLGILVGSNSIEREVSFLSCKEVEKNINKNKYNIEIFEIPIEKNNNWIENLIKFSPDIVLSTLHGGIGENGTIQGLLESLNIPYLGSKIMSSSICINKKMSKEILHLNKIPIVDFVFMKKDESILIYEEKIYELGYPLVVKPNTGGSSVGISIVKNKTELLKGIDLVKKYNDDILIEKFIKGEEVSCGILETENGIEVIKVLDISTKNNFYDYSSKYEKKDATIIFSKLPPYQQVTIKEIAKKTFEILDCKGYGLVDIIIDEEQIYVLEVNTLPGLTSSSLIPVAVSDKWNLEEFLDKLIEFELKRA